MISKASTRDHRAQFTPALDSRNRRVSGLYVRNGRYYAQLWAERGDGRKGARRFPLFDENAEPVRALAPAKQALEIARQHRRENKLPPGGRKPSFAAVVEGYFQKATVLRKRPGTLENERQACARWLKHLGSVRIDRIDRPLLASFINARLKQGVKKRTVVLDLICLRNVLNGGIEDGQLRELPHFPKLKPEPAPKRPLITPAEFERLIAACTALDEGGLPVTKNGVQVRDYLRFLAYSGAREQEALRVRVDDVDLENGRVTVGADGCAKNHMARTIEFNPQLERLLQEMWTRRAPDSSWLFPSPQRGGRDEHARSFRESLRMVRRAAELPWVGFHDLRHMFASICVMAGIDFMTIATWMGHKDGGILVGKVYGHLLDDHRREMASRVRFGLSVLPEVIPATVAKT